MFRRSTLRLHSTQLDQSDKVDGPQNAASNTNSSNKIEARQTNSSWCCCKNSKEQKYKQIAEDHAYKELDIVTFIRKQMMIDIAFRTLFTRKERFLIKNQRKFVLD